MNVASTPEVAIRSMTVESGTLLTNDEDIESYAQRANSHAFVRGSFLDFVWQFFNDEEKASLLPTLVEPPPVGLYLAFREYPESDLLRLLGHLARKLTPELPLHEAIRRLARHDATAFSRTKVGGVLEAGLSDVMSTIRRLPLVFAMMRRGGLVKVHTIREGYAELQFQGFQASSEAWLIGTIEGWLERFQLISSLRMEWFSETDVRVVIVWDSVPPFAEADRWD